MRCVFVWSKEKKLALTIGKCEVTFGQYSTTPLDVLWLEAGAVLVKSDILRSAVSAYKKSTHLLASNPRSVVALGETQK